MSQPSRDGGYTLVEVMVVVALLGVLMAMAVSGWSTWTRAHEQSGTARELQSLLRSTHQRAITEGNAMCVQFDTAADSYTVYRGVCADPAKEHVLGPVQTDSGQVRLVSPVFTGSTVTSGVTFFARGTATPGTVTITRDGSSKTYIVAVEGLTGRVSLN